LKVFGDLLTGSFTYWFATVVLEIGGVEIPEDVLEAGGEAGGVIEGEESEVWREGDAGVVYGWD
jgi:hypothetical protein